MKKLSKILAVVMCLVTLMCTCSTLFIGASAAVTAPTFTFEVTSESGNTVTGELKLSSGTFNSFDLNFIMPEGVQCTSIETATGFSGAEKNVAKGKISCANTNGYSTSGTILTATFTVPSGVDKKGITAHFSACSVCDENNKINSVSVSDISLTEISIFVKILRAILSIFKAIFSIFTSVAA